MEKCTLNSSLQTPASTAPVRRTPSRLVPTGSFLESRLHTGGRGERQRRDGDLPTPPSILPDAFGRGERGISQYAQDISIKIY